MAIPDWVDQCLNDESEVSDSYHNSPAIILIYIVAAHDVCACCGNQILFPLKFNVSSHGSLILERPVLCFRHPDPCPFANFSLCLYSETIFSNFGRSCISPRFPSRKRRTRISVRGLQGHRCSRWLVHRLQDLFSRTPRDL